MDQILIRKSDVLRDPVKAGCGSVAVTRLSSQKDSINVLGEGQGQQYMFLGRETLHACPTQHLKDQNKRHQAS